MTTGKDMMGNSVSMSLYTENTHLQHLLHPKTFSILVSSKISAGHLSTSLLPAGGDFQGSTARAWVLYLITAGGDMAGARLRSSGSLSWRFLLNQILCEMTHNISGLSKIFSTIPTISGCLILDTKTMLHAQVESQVSGYSMAVTVRVPRTFAWKLSTRTQHFQELWD